MPASCAATSLIKLTSPHTRLPPPLQMPPHELLQLLQSFPAAAGVQAVLRPAFLELAAVPRGALLGARASFEGLRKATREPGGAVYELLLLQ